MKFIVSVRKYWFVCCMLVIMLLPLCTGNYMEKVSESENRTFSQLTLFFEFDDDGQLHIIQNPFTMLASWYQDHIGFREESIQILSVIKYKWFNIIDDEQILVGKEGNWFYEGPERHMLNTYQRIGEYSEMGMQEFCDIFVSYQEKMENNGTHFIMMLNCDKSTIYPEYMPDNVHVVGDYESFESSYGYAVENTDLDIIWMKDILFSYKENGELLYNKKIDTGHWNYLGAYIGYSEVMDHIIGYDPSVYKIEKDDIKFKKIKTEGSILYDAIKYTDEIFKYELVNPVKISYLEDCPDNEKLVGYMHYQNDDIDDQLSLLVIGDSYTSSFLLPWYAQSFKDVYFIHRESDSTDYVMNLKPNYLVYETVERCGISWIY